MKFSHRSHGARPKLDDRLAVACAVVATLGLIFFNVGYHIVAAIDTPEVDAYFVRADDLLQGRGYSDPFRPPLYTVLTAGFGMLLRGNTFLASTFVSSLAVGGLIGLTYLLAKRFVRPRFALLAQVLVAIDAVVVQSGFWGATDALFALISIALLLCAMASSSERHARARVVGLGVLFGLAYLTRYTGVFLLPLIVLALVGEVGESRGLTRKQAAKIGIAVTTALCVMSPWLIYNYLKNGSPLANENWRNFGFALYGNGDFQYLATQHFRGYIDIFLHDPSGVFHLWARNIVDTVVKTVTRHASSSSLAACLPFGVVAVARMGRDGLFLLIYFLASVLPFIVTFAYLPRLMLPVIPVLILVSVLGLMRILDFVAQLQPSLRHPVILTTTVTLLSAMVIVQPLRSLPDLVQQAIALQPIEEVGMLDHFMNEMPGMEHPTVPTRIVTTYQFLAYFSQHHERLQQRWAPHYAKDFPRSLVDMAAHDVEYVLVSDRTTHGAVRKGDIDRIAPDCWALARTQVSALGSIRLYRNGCSVTIGHQ